MLRGVDANVIARAGRYRAQDRMNIVLECMADGIGASAHVVLHDHERLIEAGLYHVTGETTINVDASLAARIHVTNLRRRRSSEGMPEDAKPREVEMTAERVPHRRVQPVKLVHDKDHILRPDHHQLIACRLRIRACVELPGGCRFYDASIREDHHIGAIGRRDGEEDVAVARDAKIVNLAII